MAICANCGASNLGTSRTPLVLADGQWFCEPCLGKSKGPVKCETCGREAFTSGEHFKTVDGRYMCTACMEKAGIMKKVDYVLVSAAHSMAGVASRAAGRIPLAKDSAPAGTATARGVSLAPLGGLRLLLDQHLSPSEAVTSVVVGNAGEAIVTSKRDIYVLKSGLAVGSITGRKCVKIPWKKVRDISIIEGSLYGILEIRSDGMPTYGAQDVSRAKKSDNAITFLLSKKAQFQEALHDLRSCLVGYSSVAD